MSRSVGRIQSRMRSARGPHRRWVRRACRWYLGLSERWSVEGELGRQPAWSAIREMYLDELGKEPR